MKQLEERAVDWVAKIYGYEPRDAAVARHAYKAGYRAALRVRAAKRRAGK